MQFYNQMKWILCKIPVRRDKLLTSNLKRQDYRQYRLNLYFHKFYGRYKKTRQQKQSYTGSHADRRFSYLLSGHSFSPNCQRIFPFYSIQQRTPWFVIGQQRTLILPIHLILPRFFFFSEVRVCSASVFFLLQTCDSKHFLFVAHVMQKSVNDKLYKILRKHLLKPLKEIIPKL